MKIIGSLALIIMMMLPNGAKKIVNNNNAQKPDQSEAQQTQELSSSEKTSDSDEELSVFEKKEPLLSLSQLESIAEEALPGFRNQIEQSWNTFSQHPSHNNESLVSKFVPSFLKRNYTFLDVIRFFNFLDKKDPEFISWDPEQHKINEVLEIIRMYPTFFPEFMNLTNEQIMQLTFNGSEVKDLGKRFYCSLADAGLKGTFLGIKVLTEGINALNKKMEETHCSII